jgi:drug/metabolite transporter (DMT)-like permease
MYLAWGTTYIAIAFAIETMPDLLGMGMRFFAASLLQLVVVGFSSGFSQFRITAKQFWNTALLGAMMLALSLGAVAMGEHVVPISVASLIISTLPLWTALLRYMDGDRPSAMSLIGVATGFIGLIFILQPSEITPRDGGNPAELMLWMIIILLGNIVWAIGSFFTTRMDVPKKPLVITTYEMFAAGIVLMGLGLVRGQTYGDVFDATWQSWLGWAYLVIVGSVIAYSTFNWLLGHAPISLVSTYSYVNPIVATALGLLFFDEKVTSTVLLGGLAVLISVALVITAESRKKTPIMGENL